MEDGIESQNKGFDVRHPNTPQHLLRQQQRKRPKSCVLPGVLLIGSFAESHPPCQSTLYAEKRC